MASSEMPDPESRYHMACVDARAVEMLAFTFAVLIVLLPLTLILVSSALRSSSCAGSSQLLGGRPVL